VVLLKTDQGNFSRYMIVILLAMGAFGVMGGGLVAPGLTTIGDAFDAPEEQIGLILSVYTFAAAVSLPIIGYYIDVVGRKKVGIACLLIDGITGLIIMYSPTFSILLILRFIQGIGIAGLVPVAMTVIGDIFSGDLRLQYMGYLSGTISVGAVLIPLLGGFLATIDWRLVFAAYGFSIALAISLYLFLPETGSRSKKNTVRNSSALEYTRSLLSTLKIKKVRNIMIHSLILFFLLYTLVTYLSLYLIGIHGFDEMFSGLALAAQAFFSAVLASRARFVADYLDWRKRASLGFALISASFVMMPVWPIGSYLVGLSFVLYGVGMGIVSPTIYTRVTRLSPPDLTGSVVAVFNTMKYVGMTLAPVVIGLMLIFLRLTTVFILVGLLSAIWALFTLLPEIKSFD